MVACTADGSVGRLSEGNRSAASFPVRYAIPTELTKQRILLLGKKIDRAAFTRFFRAIPVGSVPLWP